MKSINNYISEKLVISKNTGKKHYNYFPKDKYELYEILKQLFEERGKDANLNDIDVSKIVDMGEDDSDNLEYGLFYRFDPHNIDISRWDVSNVTNMKRLFYGCRNFNCDLSLWDVSNVKDMNRMFMKCVSFDCKGLKNWDVNNVEDMSYMFAYSGFNEDISNWNTQYTYIHNIFSRSPLNGKEKEWWGSNANAF